MKLAIIIPTYNERENIVPLIRAIVRVTRISRINKLDSTIIVVDDNSPDGTGEAVENLKSQISNLKSTLQVIHRPKKEGLGKAYLEGFRHALKNGADFIITMDADFSHSPADIPRLLEQVKDYDIVVGSRYVKGGRIKNWGLKPRLLSFLANLLARNLLSLKIRDCTAGFKCYSRTFLKSLDFSKFTSLSYAFQVEILYYGKKRGFLIKEIPITFVERISGPSKKSFKEIIGSAFSLIRLFSHRILGD